MKLKSQYAVPALLIVMGVLLSLASYLSDRLAGDATASALSAIVLDALIYLIPALLFCRLRGAECLPRLRLRPYGARPLLLLLVAAVFLAAGGTALGAILYHFFPEAYAASSVTALPLYVTDGTLPGTLLTLLAFVLVPAVCREFVFRSLVVSEYERFGVPCAVVMSTLLYAMLPFSFVRLPLGLLDGLVLALTAYAARSVWASVTVRVLSSSFLLLTEPYLYRAVNGNHGSGFVLLTFATVLLTFCSGFFLFYEAQKLYRHYGDAGTPSPYRQDTTPAGMASALAAPPLLLFIVLYIVLAAVQLPSAA